MAAGRLYSNWNQSGVLHSEHILEVRNVLGKMQSSALICSCYNVVRTSLCPPRGSTIITCTLKGPLNFETSGLYEH